MVILGFSNFLFLNIWLSDGIVSLYTIQHSRLVIMSHHFTIVRPTLGTVFKSVYIKV